METVVYDAYPKIELDYFLPELQLEIPELPDETVLAYIRSAAIEFCERSLVLQREMTLCLQPCVPNYLLTSPDCTRIVAISGVSRSGGGDYQRLTSKPRHVMCLHRAAWWDRVEGSIWLHPAPTERDTINIRMSVAPTQEACEIEAVLHEKYRDAILAGTRAALYAIPRRAWSNIDMADRSRQDFERRIAAAGVDRLLGGQRGAITMKHIFNRRL